MASKSTFHPCCSSWICPISGCGYYLNRNKDVLECVSCSYTTIVPNIVIFQNGTVKYTNSQETTLCEHCLKTTPSCHLCDKTLTNNCGRIAYMTKCKPACDECIHAIMIKWYPS